MCRGQESDIEEQRVDEALLESFRRWKTYMSWGLTDEEVQAVDWIEDFVSGAWIRLQELHDQRAFTDTELDVFCEEFCAYLDKKDRSDVRNDVAR